MTIADLPSMTVTAWERGTLSPVSAMRTWLIASFKISDWE